MIKRIYAVLQFTLVEELRNRVLNATILFCLVIAYFGVVLTRLAQGYEERFFRDISFALLQLFGVVILLQSVYRIVREDMRRGSGIEIFFVRPITRWEFLIGRFLGLATLLLVAMAIMGGVILGFMAWQDFAVPWIYGAVFLEVFLKLWIVLNIAALMACVTTSQASYFVATLLIFASGHMTHLLRRLLEQPEGANVLVFILAKPLTYVLPNFYLFGLVNNMEAALSGAVSFSWEELTLSCAYGLLYGAVALIFSAILFSKKEIL